jgi:hypothetical protein
MSDKNKEAFRILHNYCVEEGYKGYDPYDGLNSTVFRSLPLLNRNKYARLVWIQFFKLFPLNLRKLVGIKKEYNPKALGLFLSGYCNLSEMRTGNDYSDKISFLHKQLLSLISLNWSGACWGYNFDWQAKAFYQPKHTPTVVATSFISNAFLDAYELTEFPEYLEIARSSCDFIIKDLNRTWDSNGDFAFSYSPLDNSVVFNASLLASRLLARVYEKTKEDNLLSIARKSVSFCCNHQKTDGSWSYGTADFHRRIDNFHTGYNLECISDYMKFSGDKSYENNLRKGFDYYINTFFTEKGISKYYNNSVYPVDIHAPAQLVITLSKLNKFEEYRALLENVLGWTIENMQSPKGYFYYRKNRFYKSRISYMRWAQAWMFYALSEYLLNIE